MVFGAGLRFVSAFTALTFLGDICVFGFVLFIPLQYLKGGDRVGFHKRPAFCG